MRYSVAIPVTRYQMAILERVLGANPWKLNTRIWLGKILIGHLGKSRRIPHSMEATGQEFIIELPPSFVSRRGLNFISDENITDFLKAVEDDFRRGLFAFVEKGLLVRVKIGQGRIKELDLTIKDSIRQYCTKSGIEEADIPFDGLVKAFYRARRSAESSVVLSKEFYSSKVSRTQ